jgi:hypothetical protein
MVLATGDHMPVLVIGTLLVLFAVAVILICLFLIGLMKVIIVASVVLAKVLLLAIVGAILYLVFRD